MAALAHIAVPVEAFVYDNGPVGDPDGAPIDIESLLRNGYDMVTGVLIDNQEALLYVIKLGLIFAFGYAMFSLYRGRGGDGD